MSKAQQTQLLGTPSEDAAYIETNGRVLKPAAALLTALADELKLDVQDDGLHTRFIEPSNVAMGDVSIYAEAFDTYDLDDELTLGVNITRTAQTIQKARMAHGNTDDITLDLDERRTLVSIDREYAGHDLELSDELMNLDAASVRERPQRPPINEYLTWAADVDVSALYDVVDHFDSDTTIFVERDGHLLVGEVDRDNIHEGDCATVGDFGPIATELNTPEGGESALLSMGYLGDVVPALKQAKVTDLIVRWGDDVPVVFDFERTVDETTLYEGEFIISPRLQTGDDEEAA